jgi:hypothetical protein
MYDEREASTILHECTATYIYITKAEPTIYCMIAAKATELQQ